MPNEIFRCHHRVSYAECTLGNHIYFARYLDLLEIARGEFFRALGVPLLAWQQQDIAFPVIECHVFYKAPARYDDLLSIEVALAEMGRVRLNFRYRILNQAERLVLEGTTLHICASVGEKVRRVPEALRQKLSAVAGMILNAA